MRSAFRTGQLVPDSDLLEALPRPALIAAIVRHATSLPIHGEPMKTYHEEGDLRFHLETDTNRQTTVIRRGWACAS